MSACSICVDPGTAPTLALMPACTLLEFLQRKARQLMREILTR